ncbi:unnamed protein product, partial [Bubo scandiacus]
PRRRGRPAPGSPRHCSPPPPLHPPARPRPAPLGHFPRQASAAAGGGAPHSPRSGPAHPPAAAAAPPGRAARCPPAGLAAGRGAVPAHAAAAHAAP